MNEDVIEVVTDRPQDAMDEVEKLECAKEEALFGKGLHVVAADCEAAVETIGSRLRAAGFHVERIGKIAPSLEDVFVSLIEERDRAEGRLAEVRR